MSRSAQIRARAEPEVKAGAEAVLEKLGLSPSAAINMFYAQIIHHQGIPFPLELPNEETRKAIQEAREGRNLLEAESLEGLLAALDEGD